MIVDPNFPRNLKCKGCRTVYDICTILTYEYQFIVKNKVIYPINDPRCAIIRKLRHYVAVAQSK